jgi:hypothetical protein
MQKGNPAGLRKKIIRLRRTAGREANAHGQLSMIVNTL